MIPSEHTDVRYALIKEGTNPLIVVGLNPSTADETSPDNTMKSVLRIAGNNHYDGFVMLNLYPLRSTEPRMLPIESVDENHHQNNLQIVKDILLRYPYSDILVAYGNFALERKYLKKYAEELLVIFQDMNRNILCIDKTKKGMPKHPLYASAKSLLKPF